MASNIKSHDDDWSSTPWQETGPPRSWDAPQTSLFERSGFATPENQTKWYGSAQREVRNPTPRSLPTYETSPLPFHADDAASTTPSDPALHTLRQRNSHLNDYQFFGTGTGGHVTELYAKHKDNHDKPSEGHMRWAGAKGYGDTEPHAVDMVTVDRDHRGKGLATALWDYAHLSPQFEQSRPQHSGHRSDSGDGWARHVGGELPSRTGGKGVGNYA